MRPARSTSRPDGPRPLSSRPSAWASAMNSSNSATTDSTRASGGSLCSQRVIGSPCGRARTRTGSRASGSEAPGDVFGAVELRVMDGAQQDVEPLLLVGLARPLAGEVEVVVDLLGRVQAGPGCVADHLGDQVAAGLVGRPGAGQTLADLEFHG